MLLQIDTNSPDPLYAQLVRQVRAAIASGKLAVGEKLPSHRELGMTLVVNHLTVKRAFDELEQEGLLTTRRGLGTFVVEVLPAALQKRSTQIVVDDLARAAAVARDAGMTQQEWNRLANQAWKDIR